MTKEFLGGGSSQIHMEFVDDTTIKIDKVLNELDRFVLRFTEILSKHANYVIISGFVSIIFGRARATEDIDIFISPLDENQFAALYSNLVDMGYQCLNAKSVSELFAYLTDGLAIRFAEIETVIPNFEVKFASKPLQQLALKKPLTVLFKDGILKISPLEQQVAFKRFYLKSPKDIEDAAHLENVFKDRIDPVKIKEIKRLIENEVS